MSLLLRRAVLCARGPIGQYLPRTLAGSQPTILSQISKLSSSQGPVTWNKSNDQKFLTSESLVKVQSRSSHGNHVTLWTAERALSGAMVPIIPLAFIYPSPIMDSLLALTITLHSHWGIEAIVVDYVRPSVFGKTIPRIAIASVYALSFMTLGGLLYFIYADVGIVQAIKMLWKL